MADRRFLHAVAVYFGLADETADVRRARLEGPDPPLVPLLLWSLVSGALVGAIYRLLFTSVVRGVLCGLVLGAGLFGVRLYERWRTDQDRRADEPGD